jgi:hypothetical protein
VDLIDTRLEAIAKHRFRAKFHLHPGDRDRSIALVRGPTAMRKHAHDIIAERLAPAQPKKDGKQTPYRGHPVFVAQHATATCCRSCLKLAHQIEKDRVLTADEHSYVVDVICRWIERELSAS